MNKSYNTWLILKPDELEQLDGMQEFDVKLYLIIRKFMDSQTLITGIKRKISRQSLGEEMWVEPTKGSTATTGSPTPKKLRCAIKRLKKKGLIEVLSKEKQLIFKCVLAPTPESVQNMKGRGGAETKGRYENPESLDTQDYAANEPSKNGLPQNSKKGIPLVSSNKALSSTSYYLSETSTKENIVSDPCPHQSIIDLYHQKLPMCPKVRMWTKTRRDHLRTRWREMPNIELWGEFFDEVARSDFLTGKVSTRDGKSFLASLEWLIRPENFAKVIEEKYKNRGTR